MSWKAGHLMLLRKRNGKRGLMQISRKHTIISYLIILFVFAADAYSQKAPETDKPHRHVGENIQYARKLPCQVDNS